MYKEALQKHLQTLALKMKYFKTFDREIKLCYQNQ